MGLSKNERLLQFALQQPFWYVLLPDVAQQYRIIAYLQISL